MKRFIFILLTWITSTSIQFHLQNQTQLPLNNVPASISAISDDKIILTVLTSDNRYLYLVSGANYSNATYISRQNDNSRSFFIGDKRYQIFNNLQVDEIQYQRDYIAYSVSGQLTLSEGAILLDNFALFSYKSTCAQIFKMDLKTGNYETILLEPQQNCTSAKAGNFTHLR